MYQSLLFSIFLIVGLQSTFAFECPNHLEGQYANTEDCSSFFRCRKGVAYRHQCPSGLFFNQQELVCDFPENSECVITSNGGASLKEPKFDIKSFRMEDIKGVLTKLAFCVDLSDGEYRNPADCGTFFHCSNQLTYLKQCPSILHFSEATRRCEWPEDANCTVDSVTTEAPTTVRPTTQNPGQGGNFTCEDKECGRYEDEDDCAGYWICGEDKIPEHGECPDGLLFNPELSDCDLPGNVTCSGSTPEVTTTTVKSPTTTESSNQTTTTKDITEETTPEGNEEDSTTTQAVSTTTPANGNETTTTTTTTQAPGPESTTEEDEEDNGETTPSTGEETTPQEGGGETTPSEEDDTTPDNNNETTQPPVQETTEGEDDDESTTTTQAVPTTTTASGNKTTTTTTTTTQAPTTEEEESGEDDTTPSTGEESTPDGSDRNTTTIRPTRPPRTTTTTQKTTPEENEDDESTTELVYTSTPAAKTTTLSSVTEPDDDCSACGLFGNPRDCSRYFLCAEGIRVELRCHAGLRFDSLTFECVAAEEAHCVGESLIELPQIS